MSSIKYILTKKFCGRTSLSQSQYLTSTLPVEGRKERVILTLRSPLLELSIRSPCGDVPFVSGVRSQLSESSAMGEQAKKEGGIAVVVPFS